MKERYIALMAKTLSAYTDEHIKDYFTRVRTQGLTEHGFARLTSNLGVLISHGIRTDLFQLFIEMMDFCCATVPTVKAANDFAVRELVTCILELEQNGTVDRETSGRWRAALGTIVPETCYTVYAKKPTDPVRNWALFTAVSEYLRQAAGICDSREFIDVQLASQMQWLDENGMYMDHEGTEIHQPIVYDLVPRTLFTLLLHFGYRGAFYERIDACLRKTALLTLKMQSVTGEIPFGGRSNQFLHNEGLLAILYEYEAKRYAEEGNTALAARFKAEATRAVSMIETWLGESPISHVKNRFPLKTKYGCEKYGYFDKYMITTASWLYDAYLICDDSIEAAAEPDRTPTVFETSEHFHKLFLRAGGYALEFDTNADLKYDASGLGRVHREGAPSALCLSLPCPATPNYTIDRTDAIPLSLAPAVRTDGTWCFATTGATKYDVNSILTDESAAYTVLSCRFPTGESVEARYSLKETGVEIEILGDGEIGYLLPALTFDGKISSDITRTDTTLTVSYMGWNCLYTTDGTVLDTEQNACNRNGHYHAFLAAGKKHLKIKIEILKSL